METNVPHGSFSSCVGEHPTTAILIVFVFRFVFVGFLFAVDDEGADASVRDYSGKKPYQYRRQDTVISTDTFRSEYHPHPAKSNFDRGGIYSSLKNSLFKFHPSAAAAAAPAPAESHPDGVGGPSAAPAAAADPPTPQASSCFPERRVAKKSASFLREFRPSFRKRPNKHHQHHNNNNNNNYSSKNNNNNNNNNVDDGDEV